ncbi:MAG TPA: hypothetical protein VGH77_07650 [Streptosporangiaceae bacterium]
MIDGSPVTEGNPGGAGQTTPGAGEPAMVAAGRAIIASAAARSIPVRLVGGVAIYLRGSPPARAALGRSYPDVDLVAHKKQSRALRAVLEETGFAPERVFNATHGARRLLYHAPAGWQVDVFLDTFEMSHTLDLGRRLEAEPETLAAAELLLTKLQIAEVNRKDLSDTAMLLWDHQPARQDGPGLLNVTAVTDRCAADWGLHTTLTDNLAACAGMLGELVSDEAHRARIAARIGQLSQALTDAPKSLGWKARAKVGRRVRWYQLPEEVTR